MYAKGLVVAAKSNIIGKRPARYAYHVGVIVLVGGQFAHHVLARNADAQSHGLALVAGRVFLRHRPVGAPATTKALLVAELSGVLHVDDAGGKLQVGDITAETDVHSAVTTAGIKGVVGGHGHGGGGTRGEPFFVVYLDDGAQRTTGHDALTAMLHILDHRRRIAVPSTEGTQTKCFAHPEHVIAIAGGLLLVVGIKLGGLQLQSLAVFAIDVHCLSMVKVDTVGHQFVLKGASVVVEHPVGIHVAVYGQL